MWVHEGLFDLSFRRDVWSTQNCNTSDLRCKPGRFGRAWAERPAQGPRSGFSFKASRKPRKTRLLVMIPVSFCFVVLILRAQWGSSVFKPNGLTSLMLPVLNREQHCTSEPNGGLCSLAPAVANALAFGVSPRCVHMAVGQNQWYHFGVGEFTHFSLF